MSSLGLNSVRNTPSISVLPAQRSLVLCDSKYRPRSKVVDAFGNQTQIETEDETPYDFQVDLSAALVGKEVVYQKLYWNQAIYSHTNISAELRFQINGDDTKTYVVYAVPFLMFTEFDGNPPGIPFGVPQTFSYAKMMELGFNGDVRLLQSNLQLINTDKTNVGSLYDADGFLMTVYFRYSPAQGFSISFAPSINPNLPVYTIRLLPCDYIANAHFVHGFGIYDASISPNQFVPRNQWTMAYFSDDTPNLLPFRYIVVRSDELVKDRRMISFQNSTSNRFNNELAVISLNHGFTGTYHTENIGDDATVISKRDDYQPRTIRIRITDEDGNILIADSPVSNLLQTPDIVDDYTKNSFVSGAFMGRGNTNFVNDLVFGFDTQRIVPVPLVAGLLDPPILPQSILVNPKGITNYLTVTYGDAPYVGSQTIMNTSFWLWYRTNGSNGFRQDFNNTSLPVIVTPNYVAYFPPVPDAMTYVGINAAVYSQVPMSMFGRTPQVASGIIPEVSVFTWDPVKNPSPSVALDAKLEASFFNAPPGTQSKFGTVYCWLCAYSMELGEVVLASPLITGLSFYPVLTYVVLSVTDPPMLMTRNPNFPNLTGVHHIAFYFSFQNSYTKKPVDPDTQKVAHQKISFTVPSPQIVFRNPNAVNIQTEYFSPATNTEDDNGYEFGNPQASAKAEELIHEIILVTDKN